MSEVMVISIRINVGGGGERGNGGVDAVPPATLSSLLYHNQPPSLCKFLCKTFEHESLPFGVSIRPVLNIWLGILAQIALTEPPVSLPDKKHHYAPHLLKQECYLLLPTQRSQTGLTVH